jgi:hypothetical protein
MKEAEGTPYRCGTASALLAKSRNSQNQKTAIANNARARQDHFGSYTFVRLGSVLYQSGMHASCTAVHRTGHERYRLVLLAAVLQSVDTVVP